MLSSMKNFLWNRNKVEPEKQITTVAYLITNGTYTRVAPSSSAGTAKKPSRSMLAARTMSDSSQKQEQDLTKISLVPSPSLTQDEINQDYPSAVEQVNGRSRIPVGAVKRILSRIQEDDGGLGEDMVSPKVMSICPSPMLSGDKNSFSAPRSFPRRTATLPLSIGSTIRIAAPIKRRRITHLFPGIILSSTMAPRRKTFL